jgi:hypothetical protein
MFQSHYQWWDVLCILDFPNDTGYVYTVGDEKKLEELKILTTPQSVAAMKLLPATYTEDMPHYLADQKVYQALVSGMSFKLDQAWVRAYLTAYTKKLIAVWQYKKYLHHHNHQLHQHSAYPPLPPAADGASGSSSTGSNAYVTTNNPLKASAANTPTSSVTSPVPVTPTSTDDTPPPPAAAANATSSSSAVTSSIHWNENTKKLLYINHPRFKQMLKTYASSHSGSGGSTHSGHSSGASTHVFEPPTFTIHDTIAMEWLVHGILPHGDRCTWEEIIRVLASTSPTPPTFPSEHTNKDDTSENRALAVALYSYIYQALGKLSYESELSIMELTAIYEGIALFVSTSSEEVRLQWLIWAMQFLSADRITGLRILAMGLFHADEQIRAYTMHILVAIRSFPTTEPLIAALGDWFTTALDHELLAFA